MVYEVDQPNEDRQLIYIVAVLQYRVNFYSARRRRTLFVNVQRVRIQQLLNLA